MCCSATRKWVLSREWVVSHNQVNPKHRDRDVDDATAPQDLPVTNIEPVTIHDIPTAILNLGDCELSLRSRAWRDRSATIELTRLLIRNGEAGCRRGVETGSRGSSLLVALRPLLPSAAAASALTLTDLRSRRRRPWPWRASQTSKQNCTRSV